MIGTELLPRVAQKIRAIRSNKNLTLAELSKNSNVSKGLLSKIENSRTTPSLPVFLGIVNALGVSLKDFFEGIDLLSDKDYLLIKKEDQQPSWRESKDGIFYRFLMSQNMPGSSVEITLTTVLPGNQNALETSAGFQFIYVISGECEYFIEKEKVHLTDGDALYFDGTKPHFHLNTGNTTLNMLVIYFLK